MGLKVILFGATGMIGQGVLRECLLDPEVERVLTVGRGATGQWHDKLREVERKDLADLSPIAADLRGYDACFFCLGVSAAGLSETEYRKLTYDLTLGAAKTLVAENPQMTFVYVSGASTDSTERGSVMWARVKGATENALLKLPFKATYLFRPAMIQPMYGSVSRTRLYRIVYTILIPFWPLLRRFPKIATTTERVAKAMLIVARRGADKKVLESIDINAIALGGAA